METFFRLAIRERRIQFMYLLVSVLVLWGLTSWIVFRNETYSGADSKRLSDRIRMQEQILKNQLVNLPLLDSVYRSIVEYQPQVNAIFVEVEIDDHLNEIRRLSSPQTNGIQFRSFGQIADLYKMMYVDKKIAWSKQANIQHFREKVADCNIFPGAGVAPAATPSVTSSP